MGVDLSDEHVVARREVLVLKPFVLHDDGLLLRIEHVDPAVEHRHGHGERTFQQQHVVEDMPAHEIQDDLPRMPFADGGEDIERRGCHEAPHAVEGETPRLVIAACGGQDREHDERYDQVVDQLQRQLRSPRRPVVERAVIELLAVAHTQFVHHRMGAVTARGDHVDHQPVAVRKIHPADALHRHVDAVAVPVDDVPVAVGADVQHPFLAACDDARPRRPRLSFALLLDDQQQHIGKVDHQADGQRNQQVEHQVGIFRLQVHRISLRPGGVIHPP